MANVTLSIPDDILLKGRDYAKKHHTSLNEMIRTLLHKTLIGSSSDNWLSECFKLMDKAKPKARLKNFKRDDIYDV